MNVEELIKTAYETFTTLGMKVLAAGAILVTGRWVARHLVRLLRKAMERAKLEDTLTRFLGNLAHAALLVFVVLAAISQLGIQTASFVAVIGAAGLAVGLALQGSLANFAAGAMIIIFRPYKAGDYIEAAGTAGKVQDVQIFTTVLNTPDNKTVVVPNGKMMSGVITNFNTNDTRRVDLVIGVAYEDDLDRARAVLQEVLGEDERILADPAPVIAVHELADSSVNFVVRPWVKAAHYWLARWGLTETIKKRFDREGISFPFPQRDVHLYKHDPEDGAAQGAARAS